MPLYRYSIVEYDPDRPWIVVGQHSGLEVELPDIVAFTDWAAERWPSPGYMAELMPWQFGRSLKLTSNPACPSASGTKSGMGAESSRDKRQ
jgi:hypothetical protein